MAERLTVKILINSVFVAIVTAVYAGVYWLGSHGSIGIMQDAGSLVSAGYYKPYVYRQLVPMLTRLLASLGIRIDIALVLIVTASGVLFYLALRSLIAYYHPMDNALEIITLFSVFAGMLLFGDFRMPYDLTTAALFTLAFVFITKGQTINYLILFPFACLNRETAFLLIVVYFISHIYIQNSTIIYLEILQCGVYILVTVGLRVIFADNPGTSAWVEPWLNLLRFYNHPARTLLHLAGTGVVLWMVAKGWTYKPMLFRTAFIVMAPILTAFYLVLGQAFEVRAYWELYPVLAGLMIPTIRDFIA